MRFWKLLGRAVRLRCPRCGQGKMFHSWFRMKPACDSCQLPFAREPGYFLGSIYFNYGLTALLVVATYFPLYFSGWVTSQQLLWGELVFSILFPLWFFRYARCLWVGFDELFDPVGDTRPPNQKTRSADTDDPGLRA